MMPNNLDRVKQASPKELASILTDMIDEYICPLRDNNGVDRTADCANAILTWLYETGNQEVKSNA